jgi:hypothetical protein
MSTIEIETQVKGGLPVIAILDYESSDPSVGIMGDSVDYPTIHWLSGNQVTDKVFESIPQSDIERIMIEALESKQNNQVYS